MRAFVSWMDGRLDEAERLYRAEVADHPDDVEGWYQLGALLFNGNPLRSRSATDARAPFERVLALDPANADALVHLARIAFLEGDGAEVDSRRRRVLALTPSSEVLELRAFRATALGDRQGQRRVTTELLAATRDSARRLERTGDTAPAGSRASRARWTFAHSLRARLADAAGQPAAALAELEQAAWPRIASSFLDEAPDRYYRAELLERLGRLEEARGWFRSIA